MRFGEFEGASAEWDEFVRTNAGWTHFHLFGWKRVIEAVFGHQCVYLCSRDDSGRLTGVLPLVRVKSRLFGHFMVSMPFLNYGGPLGDEESVRELVARAAAQARGDGVDLLELRSRRPLPIDLTVSHRKITMVLDLCGRDPDELWESFPSKLRTKVRRSRKEGFTVRFGNDQVAPFHAVYSERMRDLGTPSQSVRLFQAVADAFPADIWFGCAYEDDVPVAGGCGFLWDGEFEMTWSASRRSHQRRRPSLALYWAFLERTAAEGVARFNFGRSTPGSGPHEFKRQWGARQEPLWWYQWASGGLGSTPSPDSGRYRMGPRVWRHLPLSLTNRLGPRIVRFIP